MPVDYYPVGSALALWNLAVQASPIAGSHEEYIQMYHGPMVFVTSCSTLLAGVYAGTILMPLIPPSNTGSYPVIVYTITDVYTGVANTDRIFPFTMSGRFKVVGLTIACNFGLWNATANTTSYGTLAYKLTHYDGTTETVIKDWTDFAAAAAPNSATGVNYVAILRTTGLSQVFIAGNILRLYLRTKCTAGTDIKVSVNIGTHHLVLEGA